MDLMELSPVLVCYHQVHDDVLNVTKSKVDAYISANLDKIVSPDGEIVKSTYDTDKNFLKHANLVELEQEILSNANSFLQHLGFKFDRELKVTSWLNLFDKNVMEQEHTHYKSMISGCYYVDSDGTGDSGRFYITDQIPQREQNRTQYGLVRNDQHAIDPVPGRILFFESWMRHGVFPNKTDKRRISIAFNVD